MVEIPDSTPSHDVTELSVTFAADTTHITLAGEVDLAMRSDLDAVGSLAIDYGAPIEVDVSRVTFIDSAGLSFLARLVRAGQASGWRLHVIGAGRRVRETLQIAGLLTALDLTDPA
jgi:anti-sigma B factor antagonist